MHIHELIIHRDLDTPLEIEIFAFESKRIYCAIKYVLLFVFDKFHENLFDCFWAPGYFILLIKWPNSRTAKMANFWLDKWRQ